LLSLNYQPNAGAISVGIIKARNLKAKDINGLSGLSTLSSLLRPLCDTVRHDNGSAGHGSRLKWVNKFEWVTWVTGQYL